MADEPQSGQTTLVSDGSPDTGTQENWYGPEHAEKVSQCGWKEPNDVVKNFIELEKTLGGRVKIPTEQSTLEERTSFYKSIGVPEGPEGYEIKDVPGNVIRDEDAELALKGVAFKGNCPKETFEAIVNAFYKRQSDDLIASRTEGESLLKAEWSKPGEYDANIEIMKRAVNELFSEETKAIFETTGIGNQPSLVKDLHNIGLKMLSDTLIKGVTPGGDADKDYKPASPNSPEMYAHGDSEECQKARRWFEAKGHKY